MQQRRTVMAQWIILQTIFFICACVIQFTKGLGFEIEPHDVELLAGGLAMLKCTVVDIGNAQVYWRYVDDSERIVPLSQGIDVAKYASIHGELSSRLSIRGDQRNGEYNLFIANVTRQDQRQYICSVITPSNAAYDSRRASLILSPLQPDPRPACSAEVISGSAGFNVGSLVRFTCALASGSPTRRLGWARVGVPRRRLLLCSDSPCIYNRVLNLDDVNTTFVCELLDITSGSDRIECSYTPLPISIGVVIDPAVSRTPPGERMGFVCFSVNHDPLTLSFQWYRDSVLVPNGTGMSLVNLRIKREYAGSRLSCVISSLSGMFQGVGHSRIEIFDPEEAFPDIIVEGSSSPNAFSVYESATSPQTTPVITEAGKDEGVLTDSPTNQLTSRPRLTLQPIAEVSNPEDAQSKHLSILVVVSAIAGALVTLLICAVGLGIALFIRKRRKSSFPVAIGNGRKQMHAQNRDIDGRFEMNTLHGNGLGMGGTNRESGTYNEVVDLVGTRATETRKLSTKSDEESSNDAFYATLDPDCPEGEYADKFLQKHTESEANTSTILSSSTPNDYARPQTRPANVDFTGPMLPGMVNPAFSRQNERTLSDSSVGAYAITDLVSSEVRLAFKDMLSSDDTDIGVCRHHSHDRSATMSMDMVRNMSAPPLPARTLPRTFSASGVENDEESSMSQRRQSDSDAWKRKRNNESKSGSWWLWPMKAKHQSLPVSPVQSNMLSPPDEVDGTRPLSFGSAGSGEYAEIVSDDSARTSGSEQVDDKGELSPIHKHLNRRERLDSIPEASSLTKGATPEDVSECSNVSAYASCSLSNFEQPSAGQNHSSHYKSVCANRDASSRPKSASTIPTYAKVQKSKSLDYDNRSRSDRNECSRIPEKGHDTQRPNTLGSFNGIMSFPRSNIAPLVRSLSEGGSDPRDVYSDIQDKNANKTNKSKKLRSLFAENIDNLPGQTSDIQERELDDGDKLVINGGHLAEIV